MDLYDVFTEEIGNTKFFSEIWETLPYLFKHKIPSEVFSDGYLSTDEFYLMLLKAGDRCAFFKEGARHPCKDFAEAYVEGASIILNQADRFSTKLYNLCRKLAVRHFYHVFAVAYLTPKNSYAVPAHSDDQDVFIVQIWGSKNWKIYRPTVELPLTEEMVGKETPIVQALGDPILELQLNQGEVLYIPRGFIHEASTSSEHSLHITITIATSNFCLCSIVEKLIKELLKNGRVEKSIIKSWRTAICEKKNGEDPFEYLQGAIEKLQSWILPDLIKETFLLEIEEVNKKQESAYKDHQNVEKKLRGVTLSQVTKIMLSPGIKGICSPDNKSVVFYKENKSLKMKISPSCSEMMRQICSGFEYQIQELDVVDKFERSSVCRLLIQNNLLTVIGNP